MSKGKELGKGEEPKDVSVSFFFLLLEHIEEYIDSPMPNNNKSARVLSSEVES